MKPVYIRYVVILAVVVLSSCTAPRMFTTLDLLRPAEVTFKPGVKHILIVNNSVAQADNVGHFDLRNSDGTVLSESLRFDSAALFCNASLRENIESQEFFVSVNVLHTNLNQTNDFNNPEPLQAADVKNLCEWYNVDAVVSLDQIQTVDHTDVYYSGYREFKALDVAVNTLWSIHYPDTTQSSYVQFTDEFSWETEPGQQLPNRYDALVDACILTGYNVSERMVPQWEKQERYFYCPKKPLMEQAMDSVTSRNWKAAIELWEKASIQSKSNNTRFMTANNIAIAYEILGDIDKALEYCQLVVSLYPYIIKINLSSEDLVFYNILNYYEFLKKRKDEVVLINKQLSD